MPRVSTRSAARRPASATASAWYEAGGSMPVHVPDCATIVSGSRPSASPTMSLAAVQERDGPPDGPRHIDDSGERVAVFGKDDDRLRYPIDQATKCRQLGLPGGCSLRGSGKRGEETPFECAVAQADRVLPSRRFV